MTSTSVRTILPLSIVTCTSMLAMDLYLPAVPTLQQSLGIDVTLAQATVALFLAGLAASQLLWAEVLTRMGPRKCVLIGVSLLAVCSAVAALAPGIEVFLAMRLLQGIGAGVATVVAPSVVRATLSGNDAVRGFASISMVESIVPAAGPILGAALLLHTDWRGLFWVLGVLTLAVLPFVIRITPRELPGIDRSVAAGYVVILSNRKYLRLAAAHALSVGALLTFVASAPQLMANLLGLGPSAFAMLQVLGVTVFFIVASQSGRISKSVGAASAVQFGAWVQLLSCIAFLTGALIVDLSFGAIAAFWCVFCGALAVRGPSAFSEALALPPAQMGRASAMLVLGILSAGAVGTQLVAPFMEDVSAAALAVSMVIPCFVSLVLVTPYPPGRSS